MFDEATITVKSGDGGNGMSHFHREKYVARGGPDGGDGGRGGDIIIVATRHQNTLQSFAHKRRFVAENGKPGARNNMSGADAEDIEIQVPLGTIIRDAQNDEIIADLTKHDQRVIVAKGGRGGRG